MHVNCVVLGKIIEALHGRPYDQVLRERLLEPLTMRDSGFERQAAIVDGLADTYMTTVDGARLIHDLPVYRENWYAAGAMYATTTDLSVFSAALLSGQLIQPDTLELMMTPGLDGYGYGLWLRTEGIGGRRYQAMLRPGSAMGANAAWCHVFDADVTVIVLSNTDQTALDGFAYDVGRWIVEAG